MSVLAAIIDQGVIPVFNHEDPEICIGVVEACARAGANCVEFTNRGEFSLSAFSETARYFAKTDPSVILGVGSIVEAPTAALYIANAAKFVVGPNLNPEIARLCNRRKIAYSPGCGSVSEISNAEELGCEIVKVFPGSQVGGPGFIKAVMGPMPWSKLMPTGGVEPTEESIRAWFGAGVVAAGMGSKLISSDLLAAKDYGEIERRVADAFAILKKVRSEA